MGFELCSVSTRCIALHLGQRVQFSSHQTTESFSSCSQSLSHAFCQLQGMQPCAFFSGVASVWPLCHKASIREVLQRLLSFQQVLPAQPRITVVLQSSHWVLGHLSDQGPFQVAQFGRTASSRKSLGSSMLSLFPNDGAHCALGNFQHSRNCFIPFPRSVPPHNSISEFSG